MAGGAVNFVTEKELAEKREKEGDQPNVPYDPRPLWEKLKDAKDRKQKEWMDERQYKGPVGIDNDEAEFLEDVAKFQQRKVKEQKKKIDSEVAAFRKAQAMGNKDVILGTATQLVVDTSKESSASGAVAVTSKLVDDDGKGDSATGKQGTDLLGVKRDRTAQIVSSVVTISEGGATDDHKRKKRKKKKRSSTDTPNGTRTGASTQPATGVKTTGSSGLAGLAGYGDSDDGE